jgi:UDP-N-acetylmuramyl-tripeptide synthetase
MRLEKLLAGIVEATAPVEVTGVQEDSRQVGPGDLFVAIKGRTVDGHEFAAEAVQAGAVAVVAERPLEVSVPCFVVEDAPQALALCAGRLQGEPARKLELLGVTGTNGKTTTTTLMESILAAAGKRPGVIGTVTYRYAGESEPAPFTTPTALVLQQVLRRMVDRGCTHLCAEVSSHALQLGRIWGLDFAVAGFTHLTQDHLDLHGSMEAYLAAKLLLFQRHLRRGGTAVVNVDGGGAEKVIEAVRARGDLRLLRCSSTGREAEAQVLEMSSSIAGMKARLRLERTELELRSRLVGAYNADNILMAATCCHAAGVPAAAIAAGIEALRGVPGRLEPVEHSGGDFAVLVDYAHTPDALERAIGVLRPLCRGRLITVFGCGGDRDRTKRPLMGRAVARGADLAVVTSDNPRTEEPLSIIEAIVVGVSAEPIAKLERLEAAGRGYYVEPDRRRAIHAAIAAARPGDIVLLAGKGHEDYQILGRTKIHFDDREVAAEALRDRVPA